MPRLKRTLLLVTLLFALPLLAAACSQVNFGRDWRSASRASAGIAPDPAFTPEAVIQVYAARAFNWRGILAVHTWIATKPTDADHYTVHQVIGWRRGNGRSVVTSVADLPDRRWYDAEPKLLLDLRGPRAADLIPEIEAAVARYPHARDYTLWPGPNSNTFTAYVGREVPGLELELPVTAIGKDYLPNGNLAGVTPSGTGVQFSVLGFGGLLLSGREGLEVNLFGLVVGLDAYPPALKLPGIGRLGFANDPARSGI